VLAFGLIIAAVQLQESTGLPRPRLNLCLRFGLTGVVLVLSGAVIIWSLRVLPLQQRGRTLVTTGPFRYIRHPLYTAVCLAQGLTVFFIAQTYLALGAMLLMFLGGRVLVHYEEKLMEQRFGPAWQDYARQTPGFFPRLRTLLNFKGQ
jgi:protein-S-isoprenylcysteine O-methyltransferase Ste14